MTHLSLVDFVVPTDFRDFANTNIFENLYSPIMVDNSVIVYLKTFFSFGLAIDFVVHFIF